MKRSQHSKMLPFLLILFVSCQEDSKFKSGVAEENLLVQEPIQETVQESETMAVPEPRPITSEEISLPALQERELETRSETIQIPTPVSKTPAPQPVKFDDPFKISLKVDVVFAVDISGSMNDEILSVQNNLQKMLTTLSGSKIDARIHLMLDRDLVFAPDLDANKIAQVRQRVGSHDAISRLNMLFSGALAGRYRNLDGTVQTTPMALRKNAGLEVVVISDDNAEGAGNLASDFDPQKTLKASFSAIVGLASSVPSKTCSVAAIGTEYQTLANASKGSVLDICAVDWSALITRLSNEMIKRNVSFTLQKKPLNPAALEVTLDKQKLATTDWAYDAKTNTLSLTKTTAVKDGSDLLIQYLPIE